MYKNFQGDFCSEMKVVKTSFIFKNGSKGEKYICYGQSYAISYQIGADTYWLLGTYIKTNTDIFDHMFASFKFME